MSHPMPDLVQNLLNLAKKAGADAADVLASNQSSVSIDVREGKLEHAERSEGLEVGLRVLVGKRQACVSSSIVDPDTLKTVAERAVFMAREAPEDPYVGLADPSDLARNVDVASLELFDPSPEPAAQALQDDATIAEAAALGVEGVSQVQTSSASYSRSEVQLAASNGFIGGYTKSRRSTYCVAISGEGTEMERDYHQDSRVFQADLASAQQIGQLAGERCVEMFGARRPKTGSYPVIFDERISSSLVGHLLQAVNGMMVARGSSWLKDALGEQVLPKGMDIIEDPLRPRVSGSKPFDAEGLPTSRRHIVKDGVLQGWTLDLANARKLGLRSTANASRGIAAPPSPSHGNVGLTQGDCDKQTLIREMGTGLLVTSMIGSTINPNTGDYSRGASGFWVENGEIAFPVNECTLAGNLRDMLMTIQPANDAQLHMNRVVPSLMVEGLVLAGE